MASADLPIWQLHRQIIDTLQEHGRAVLVAPTGSGKTTQVPQMLLDADPGMTGRIVVLQPRRVAARTVAARVAFERNVKLGGEVGYQIRFEDRTSLGTRICFVTEGILLRWLQDDPTLGDVAVILFDEFHERNLLSDVALGLVKRVQATARPDLRIMVMSATLDAEPIAKYLGDCPVLVSEGRTYPVEIQHLKHLDERPASEQAVDQLELLLNRGEQGDVLIFMPGMGEIQSTINAGRSIRTGERLEWIPLHGEIPPEEQDRAFAPNPLRKIVVATNVAETSITIDGIRHVIDSGLARIARYDGERGIGTLMIEEISRASADQRAGRAGRTSHGTAWRLWTESNHLNRPARNTPEIQRSDLAEVVLLLHSLGIRRAAEFDWLDKPDLPAVERAEALLITLGAIHPEPDLTRRNDLTEVGRKMLRLPMHPRYARMLVEAATRRCVPAAALCAALVSGRDLLVRLGREDKHTAEAREIFEGDERSDFFTLIRAFNYAANQNFSTDACRRHGIHAQSARVIAQTYQQILEIAKRERLTGDGDAEKPKDDDLLKSLAAGFVDQLAVRRDAGTLECHLMGGRTGTLVRESVVQRSNLFVAGSVREIEGRHGPMTLLALATAVTLPMLREMFPQHVIERMEHRYDRNHKRVAAVKLIYFKDLPLLAEAGEVNDDAAAGMALAKAVEQHWIELPLLNHELKQWMERVRLVGKALPGLGFPTLDADSIRELMAKAFHGLTLGKEAQATDLSSAFKGSLGPEQRAWLDESAPTFVTWPDGRRLKLLFQSDGPELQIKLHECFGLAQHPSLCEGTVPVRLWLCSPDGKRIESTTDWPTFRQMQYPKLKSGLQKKFPGNTWL